MQRPNQQILVKANYILGVVVGILGIIALFMIFYPKPQPVTVEHDNSGDALPHVRNVYDQWQFECPQYESNRNGKDGCHIGYVALDEQGREVRVNVSMSRRDGFPIPRMKVIAPLDTFLPMGIVLSLSDQEPMNVAVQYCEAQGCYINIDLAPEVVQILSGSETLMVSYHKSNQEPVFVAIKLHGFASALTELMTQEGGHDGN